MSGAKGKGYKRSWKNLLLDKGYQLRFSLFMSGLSALLMFALGWWVMDVADQATKVSKQGVKVCIPPPSVKLQTGSLDLPEPAPGRDEPVLDEPVKKDEPASKDEPTSKDEPASKDDTAKGDEAKGTEAKKAAAKDDEAKGDAAKGTEAKKAAAKGDEAKDDDAKGDTGDPAGGDPAAGDPEPEPAPKVQVTLDEDGLDEEDVAGMLIDVDKLVDYMNCRMITRAQLRDLDDGKRLIMWVLIAVGLVLVFGLTLYGIKMTHKVAGPLHKISLYMAKMKEGRYDTVWNLRKGDQLVDFYEHFKSAHAGLKSMQQEDIEQLRAAIETAEAANLAEKSPEIAAALEEMREALARKEKGLE